MPFGLSLSKASSDAAKGFDRLSPNGRLTGLHFRAC
jgi:hypothetical protein